MTFLRPETSAEAVACRAAHPDALAIAGGTDVMVGVNFDRVRPTAVIDLSGIPELRDWSIEGEMIRIGSAMTYRRVIDELGDRLPGLAMASRTVGSPHIRNRGTLGGNLGTASPAGDALPPLYASGAEVELVSQRGSRVLPIDAFVVGPKRTALRSDELIAAIRVPAGDGPQQFSKVGTRNAMVIAVCSLALAVSVRRRQVSVCVGSAGPTPIRATDAEAFAAGELEALWEVPAPLPASMLQNFGELVARAASPIDDVRGSAAYRRRALAVLARRTLTWAWADLRGDAT